METQRKIAEPDSGATRGADPKGAGPLAGRTIMRFAHAFESGGGTERYLDDLDRTLLARNAMTIVYLHLTRNPPRETAIEEPIGQGTLIRVPLQIVPGADANSPAHHGSALLRFKQRVRDWLLYNPLVWHTVGARWTSSRKLPAQAGQAVGAGRAAADVMRSRSIDLIMMHYFGGADADEVIAEAKSSGVPVALLNHYSNDRFLHLAIRKHAMSAARVAGVNGLEVPAYVQGGFANLSDGIDTEFFRRERAAPVQLDSAIPIILLPARVVREKGQLDLVRAVASLRDAGVDCGIAFAGRVDASGFVEELHREIDRAGLSGRVRFLGNLSVEELRAWYAASAVVAFPTYHHEGLGRVIVEAQAMEKPVVAYATGGVAEGIDSGTTGYLVRTGDVKGLERHLRELLESKVRREAMGARGRKVAEERFSLGALAERHERFYDEVITAANRA